ncbi:FAD/FMN-containing dehydrogenase [Bacillus sp. SLBN-46]|uniref:FAD-binding oxidoreductase n=1 Tax=Bacillus sp. SLBN-46 TaxID=3042283 RepID=UPI0028623751|nr:FAD-binding oxidoreductase [Bacillus sp. SLBN-46]MDR6123547.1 FAD/FMN-containing dehydrogenase [Bacillus sp. SLBN-46]
MFHLLENQVGSRLMLPGDNQFEERRKVWNTAVDKKPAAIVVCESEEDVIAAVQFAKENQLSISIRGGGHHVGGFAVCDGGLMIDLSQMRKVIVDESKQVAIVEGGATLGDIDFETQKYGLAVPTGTVSETGVAGLALNGGIGYLRGKYGLTCDNIVGARLVTADGTAVDVDDQNHPDLFWAIRGGGGNFGVVTRFEFALHKVGPEVFALDVMYDFKDAKDILQKSQTFLEKAPDEAVSINITVTVLPPAPFLPEFLHFKKVVMLLGVYAGDVKEGEAILQPLRELAEPIVDQSGVNSFAAYQKKLDPMVPDHVRVYGTSLYFDQLTDETIEQILYKIDNAPAPSILVQLWALGGKMNRVPETATPFAIREAKFVLLVDCMAMAGDDDLCKQWIDSVYGGLLPFSYKKASYLNGIGENEVATKNAFQENYARLLEIKEKYDPLNLFQHNHNIKPIK